MVVSEPSVNEYRSNEMLVKEFGILDKTVILKNGVPEELTEFVTARCIGKDEKDFERKFGAISKGMAIRIEGNPVVESWVNQSGKTVTRLVCAFEKFKPLTNNN